MFVLKWYGHLNGWHALTHVRWLLLATGVAAILLMLMQAARRSPALPVTFSAFVTVLGAASFLWLGYRVVISVPPHQKLGAIVGWVCVIAIALAGIASIRQEGIASADEPQEIPTITPGQVGGS